MTIYIASLSVLVGRTGRDCGKEITSEHAEVEIDRIHQLPEVFPELFQLQSEYYHIQVKNSYGSITSYQFDDVDLQLPVNLVQDQMTMTCHVLLVMFCLALQASSLSSNILLFRGKTSSHAIISWLRITKHVE